MTLGIAERALGATNASLPTRAIKRAILTCTWAGTRDQHKVFAS